MRRRDRPLLFPTFTFALFITIVYPVSWLLRSRPRAWKIFILGASYVFYGAWDWRFVGLIIASSLVNGLLAFLIARNKASGGRAWLTLAVLFNLAILGFFKYYGFFVTEVSSVFFRMGVSVNLPLLEVLLPVGISFFTFQALSYVIDVYRRQVPAVPLLDFSVYLAFFPQLVAGPIVRATEFLPQLYHPRALLPEEASHAALLIARGLFKKIVISTFVATQIVDPVFAVPSAHSSLEILVAIYGYSVQIYADFSAYTDIAIGIALLLGFRFPLNFDRPYAANSIQDFWRRWHITLSRWLRDYLYIPLGGNRKGRLRTYLNLMITMVLGGLWHGANITFVFWGFFHGLALAVQRAWSERRAARGTTAAATPAWQTWAWRLLTFHLVCALWVFFRSPTMDHALDIFRGLFTSWGEPSPLISGLLLAVIFASIAVQWLPPDLGRRFEEGFARMPALVQGTALGLFIAFTIALGPEGVAPFIYFQF